MKDVTKDQVNACITGLGIRSGDGLLVHSAVQYLGRPQGGVGMYLEAIQEVIGEDGTVVVPTFNFAFANGERYDPDETPSQGMGSFSEYVRQHPQALRAAGPGMRPAGERRSARPLTAARARFQSATGAGR